MTNLIAVTRPVSRSIDRCELTHLTRVSIDYDVACAQHRAYERALEALGCDVQRLTELIDHPDAVFVEDAAVVLPEIAVLMRPGAAARRGEVESVESALQPHRRTVRIVAPGRLDGGDVLVVGARVFVGLSTRANEDGISQLADYLSEFEMAVTPVPVDGCLHLKSAVTCVAPELLLGNSHRVDESLFGGLEWMEVDKREAHAANALRVGDAVVFPAGYPRTRDHLDARGIRVIEVDVSELAKAEAGVTCCSLILD